MALATGCYNPRWLASCDRIIRREGQETHERHLSTYHLENRGSARQWRLGVSIQSTQPENHRRTALHGPRRDREWRPGRSAEDAGCDRLSRSRGHLGEPGSGLARPPADEDAAGEHTYGFRAFQGRQPLEAQDG